MLRIPREHRKAVLAFVVETIATGLGVPLEIVILSVFPIACWVYPEFYRHVRRRPIWYALTFVAAGSIVVVVGQWWRRHYSPTPLTPDRIAKAVVDAQADPVLDLSIGEPFGSSTVVVLRNAGSGVIDSVTVNLRCFWFRGADDEQPILFFEGFPSFDDRAWWAITELDPGPAVKKEALDALTRCIHNRRVLEKGGMAFLQEGIISADVGYQRHSDGRRYSKSTIASVFENSINGQPVTRPKPMSPAVERVLQNVTAPQYRK